MKDCLDEILSFSKCIGRVFANGPGDWGSIPGRVIPKIQKMVLDTSMLNTQHYKVRIKGKVAIQGKEWHPHIHVGVVTIEKGTFESPSTMVTNDVYSYMHTFWKFKHYTHTHTPIYIYVYNCLHILLSFYCYLDRPSASIHLFLSSCVVSLRLYLFLIAILSSHYFFLPHYCGKPSCSSVRE